MYLASLSRLGLDPNAMTFYRRGDWDGADPVACEAAGGLVSVYYDPPGGTSTYAASYRPKAHFRCTLPDRPAPSAPPANINVSVPTAVQTTVSPQVSPVFVQQDQPSGSPVSAGTAQVSPSPQTSSVTQQSSEFLEFMRAEREAQREREEREAEREQALFDLMAMQPAPDQAPPPVAPIYTPLPPIDMGAPPVIEPAPTLPVAAGGAFPNLGTVAIIAIAGVALLAFTRGGKAKRK